MTNEEKETKKDQSDVPVEEPKETKPEQPQQPVEPQKDSTTPASEESEESKSKDQPSTKETTEEKPSSKAPETPKKEQKTKDEPEKKQEKPSKKDKGAKKQEKPKKEQPGEDDDFLYIVRIANTDIDGHKQVMYGLTQIKGIGRRLAIILADKAGIDRTMKMGKLSEKQLAKINEALSEMDTHAPNWMLNHRKDIETGDDIHLISPEIDLRLRDDINMLKMIRSYRGIRHEHGLPARGQRTRANNRKGLAMGVSRKSQQQK